MTAEVATCTDGNIHVLKNKESRELKRKARVPRHILCATYDTTNKLCRVNINFARARDS